MDGAAGGFRDLLSGTSLLHYKDGRSACLLRWLWTLALVPIFHRFFTRSKWQAFVIPFFLPFYYFVDFPVVTAYDVLKLLGTAIDVALKFIALRFKLVGWTRTGIAMFVSLILYVSALTAIVLISSPVTRYSPLLGSYSLLSTFPFCTILGGHVIV